MKTLLAVILLSSIALAQDNTAAIAKAKAACGSDDVHFDLKTSTTDHAIASPDPGKALVYVVGEDISEAFYCKGCGIIARVGLNGNWMGAINGDSFLFFPVDPGEHHLCVNWQSVFATRSKRLSLANFNAEAGKVYYFRMRLTKQGQGNPPILDLDAVNSDEGQYLVLISKTGDSHVKK
jgi:hypothetical protein